jgi:hypothetical protein
MACVSGSSLKSLIASRKRRADNRIAADADARGLADAQLRQLMHGLIRERSAAAHHADVSLLVNPPRHDSHLAFPRRNNSRAVRSDQPRLGIFQHRRDANHIERRNAFRDANDQRHARVDAIRESRPRRYGGGTKIMDASAPVSRTASETVLNTCTSRCFRASLARSHARDHFGAVLDHLLRMEAAFAPVRPCTTTRVFSFTSTLIAHPLPAPQSFPRHLSCPSRSSIPTRVAQNFLSFFHVGSFHANHNRQV